MANEGGLGAFLSGMSGGYMSGKQMQRDMKVDQAKGLGLPQQQTQQVQQQPPQSATGATLPAATQPVQPGNAQPGTVESTGSWGTIAGYLKQQG